MQVLYDLRVDIVLSGDGRGGVRPPLLLYVLLLFVPCENAPRGEVAAAGGAGGGRSRTPIAESLDGGEASRWGVAPLLLLLPRLLRRRNTCWRVLMPFCEFTFDISFRNADASDATDRAKMCCKYIDNPCEEVSAAPWLRTNKLSHSNLLARPIKGWDWRWKSFSFSVKMYRRGRLATFSTSSRVRKRHGATLACHGAPPFEFSACQVEG